MAREITIHTGNILQLRELKRKPGHTPADELSDSLKILLAENSIDEISSKVLFPDELSPALKPEERQTQKVTVKLYMSSTDDSFVTKALDMVLTELGVQQADLFIISWPRLNAETSEGLWRSMEKLFESGKVLSLGISDIETQQLIDLYHSAKVKPEAVQINLEVCCTVPPELATFTRENNIQLLTHNDPVNILPNEALQSIVPSVAEVNWTIRYQTLLRCRGILQNKGYIISATVN